MSTSSTSNAAAAAGLYRVRGPEQSIQESAMRANEVTFFETAKAEERNRVLRLVDALASLVKRFREYRRRRANIATLHGMSERELKDIGVYRCDVDRIVCQMNEEAIPAALHARSAQAML